MIDYMEGMGIIYIHLFLHFYFYIYVERTLCNTGRYIPNIFDV